MRRRKKKKSARKANMEMHQSTDRVCHTYTEATQLKVNLIIRNSFYTPMQREKVADFKFPKEVFFFLSFSFNTFKIGIVSFIGKKDTKYIYIHQLMKIGHFRMSKLSSLQALACSLSCDEECRSH